MLFFRFVPRILPEACSEMHNAPVACTRSRLRIFRGRVTISLLTVLALATPVLARVVTIEGASTLTDASETSVERALDQAIATCLKTAEGMGLSWVKLDRVLLKGDRVVVEMLASDDEEDTQRDASPDGP